jgi:2'-5' RNA ligase
MIAFLPVRAPWCKQDFPHMTLVYAGEIEGRSRTDFNDMAKDAISASRVIGSFSLNVTGVDTLGDEGEEVDVLTLYPTPQLLVARSMVEKWDKSGFLDFLPHATIGPAGSAYAMQVDLGMNTDTYPGERKDTLPTNIYFNKLAVCWGDDKLIFDLNNYDY